MATTPAKKTPPAQVKKVDLPVVTLIAIEPVRVDGTDVAPGEAFDVPGALAKGLIDGGVAELGQASE